MRIELDKEIIDVRYLKKMTKLSNNSSRREAVYMQVL